jgi:hypothetical protein
MKLMRLQGVGMVEGTEAGKIEVGDIIYWNFGYTNTISKVEFTKSKKTIKVSFSETEGTRNFRINRLVCLLKKGDIKK